MFFSFYKRRPGTLQKPVYNIYYVDSQSNEILDVQTIQ